MNCRVLEEEDFRWTSSSNWVERKCKNSGENQTLASAYLSNYFRLYRKLAGMTGTAMTESEEFFDIYKLNVVSIPTNKEMLRKDFNDRIYRTEKKSILISNKIIECNRKGQPVLVELLVLKSQKKFQIF